MPQLEPLNLRITGDPRGLSVALGKSQNETRSFATGLDSQAAKLKAGLGGVAAAFAPIGIAAGAAFAAVAAGAGLAAVAISKLKEGQNAIDETAKAADKLGVSFNELGGLRLAIAESTGLDDSEADKAIEKLLINLTEAAAGAGKAKEQLDRLGLDAGALIAAGPVEALKQISERTGLITNQTEQLKLAYDLFGRSGTALITMLRGGPEAIAEAARFQEKWNGLTEQQVATVEAANDAWGRVSLIVAGITQELAAEAAPLFKTIADEILAIADGFENIDFYIKTFVEDLAAALGIAVDLAEAVGAVANLLDPSKGIGDITAGFKAAGDFSTGQNYVQKLLERRQANANESRQAAIPERLIDVIEAQTQTLKNIEANTGQPEAAPISI